MSTGKYKVLKTLVLGKGQTMELSVDESLPEDDINRYALDTISTGEEELVIPLHWHKNEEELFTVLEGSLEMTVSGKVTVLKAGDDPIRIPKRAVHGAKAYKGQRVVFREQPDPPGMYKALFFNDVFGKGGFGGILHTLRAFHDGDTYLALPLGIQMVDEAFMAVFGNFARLVTDKRPETL